MSPESQSAQLSVGTILDGMYRIDGLLGEGGMGTVYAATQLRLDKRVAVKVMARELAANPEALERFRREARITSALGHPHIVQVSDFSFAPAGEPFLVMEFLEGEDLDQRLRRLRRLPAADVVRIVKQVASALAATHAKGIVHRDLKPGNIYLVEIAGEPDFVKVLDFGISKIRTATTKLTRTTSIMGTPNYMSPEQAKGKTEDIDERTDQWALACIAWECLSGEGPFVGENVPSILFQIVHEPPPSILPKVAGLPPQVEDVLVRALAKNKLERFPSVVDFAAALEAASTGATHPHSPTAAMPSQTMRFSEDEEARSPVTIQPKSTTFTQTAGEVEADDGLDPLPAKPKWMWPAIAGGAVVVSTIAFFALRSPALSKPTPAAPRVPEPSAPAVFQPPPAPVPPPVPKEEAPTAPGAAEAPRPPTPSAGQAPTPPEPTDEAKASARKGKRKGPSVSPDFLYRVEAVPKPAHTPPASDDPFEGHPGRAPATAPAPPALRPRQLGEPAPQPPEPPKPTRSRPKEDKWRVD
jgi:eukaryotic-like serine/threonine-protein kinase